MNWTFCSPSFGKGVNVLDFLLIELQQSANVLDLLLIELRESANVLGLSLLALPRRANVSQIVQVEIQKPSTFCTSSSS